MNNTKTVQKFVKCAISKELNNRLGFDFTHLDIEIVSCEKPIKEVLYYNMVAHNLKIRAMVYEWGLIELFYVKDADGNTLYLVGAEYDE